MDRRIDVPRRVVWTALLLSAGISLFICYSTASQQLLLGDRSAGWIYPYVTALSVRAIVVASIVIVTVSTAILVLPRPDERNEWFVVLTWVAVAIALQGLVRSLPPYSMTEIFLSDGANAFYRVTLMTDPHSVLADFARERSRWPLHAQSNMPGKILLLFGLEMLSASPSVLPWFILAISSAGGALMYAFVRDVFGDRQVALFALVLYLFVPARLFFLPLLNTVTPVVFLGCAYLVLRWLQTGNQWYAAAAGVVVYGMVLFEPLPLVMGVLFVALIARALARRELSGTRLLMDLAAGALGFTAIYLGMRLFADFDLFDALRRVTEHAVEFNVNEGRPYMYWIAANLREFTFGAGFCQTVLFVMAVAYSLRTAAQDKAHLSTPLALVSVSLALILLTTDLLGINRGEVVRLWIFLACFVQIPAAYLCARLGTPAGIIVVSTTVLHTAIGAATIGFVVPG